MKRTTLILLTVLGSLSFLNGCAPSAEKTSLPSSGVRVSAPGTDAAEPAIAADAQGNIYVVYVEHGADKSGDVFLQKFDSGLKPLGEKVRVNSLAGNATAWRGDQPTVQVEGDKNVYVAWNARVNVAEGAANDLVLSISSDGGRSFAAPVKVNDDRVPASHGMHAMAVKGSDVYFAWLDERYLKKEPPKTTPEKKTMDFLHHEDEEPNAELYFAVSRDGGKTFSANKRIAGDICPCCKVSLLPVREGEFYLSWRQVLPGDLRHIAIASSRDNGETFSETTIVSDDKWHINACPVSGAPLLVPGVDGTIETAWYTAGEAGAPGLYRAESKDQGKTFSPRALLSEGVVFGTPVILSDSQAGYRLVWTANGRILTRSAAEEKPREIGEGELPAAVSSANGFNISYIKNENGKRAVWLSLVRM